MVNAAQSILDQTPEAINCLGVGIAHDVQFFRMVDACVGDGHGAGKSVVSSPVIGKHGGLRQDTFFGNPLKVLFGRVLRSHDHGAALAFHDPTHALLWTVSTGTATLPAALPFWPKIRLVHLNAFAFAADW